MQGSDIPVTISRDNIVDTKLLADFLNSQMKGISLKLLVGHICHDLSRKTHKSRDFILLRVSPAVALLPFLDAIDRRISCAKLVSSWIPSS